MYLSNHLLIAMPSLQDSTFKQAVIYLCEHDKDGAMGLVINHPVNMKVADLIKQVDEDALINDPKKAQKSVIKGGPVNVERGFILHKPQGKWESSLQLNDDFCVTTSKDILSQLANEQGPEDFILTLGYAGWTAGQLESELSHNAWLCIPADAQLVFHQPIHRQWQACIEKMGFQPWQLVDSAGHA